MSTTTMPAVALPVGDDLAAHLARLERDGFTVVPGFLDGATCARLRAHADELIGPRRADGGVHMLRHPIRGAILGELVTDAHVALASALVRGARDLRLLEQVLIRTDPGAAPGADRAWHIDWVFFPRHLARRPLPVYFQCVHALADIPVERAPTLIVPGSHHRVRAAAAALPEHPVIADLQQLEEVKKLVLARAAIDPVDAVAIPAREGDLVVFDPMCLHTGSPNVSDAPRFVFFQSFYDATDAEFGACLERSAYRAGFPDELRAAVAPHLRGLLDPVVRAGTAASLSGACDAPPAVRAAHRSPPAG